MSRKQSARARVTVYRLGRTGRLTSRIREKYLDRPDFTTQSVTVAGARGLLVTGQIRAETVRWAADLARYTSQDLAPHNDTAAATLLLKVDGHIYALCYGMGHHLLDYDTVEPGFGLQYLARIADVDDLRSVTRHTIDRRALIDRRSIPSGGDVRAFGLAELGTVVSKVVGRGAVDSDGKTVTIRGADALNLPLARDPGELITELAAVGTILTQPISHPDLELLTRLTPLQPRHAQRKNLDARLTAALRGEANERLGTGWPWEQSDEFSAVDTVRLLHVPRADDIDLPWLSIEDLRKVVEQSPSRNPLDLLRTVKVMLMGDDETVLSPQIPALKWIAFETRIDDKLYFFHDGRWFAVAQDYESQVREEAGRILSSKSSLTLPPWPDGMEEKDYNKLVVRQDRRYLLLDRDLIRTAVHPRGIEHCDLLGPGDEFVHVKRPRGSDEASHLFAQVHVATEQLLYDVDGRRALAEKVAARSGGKRTAPETPTKVVLAIGGRGKLGVDDLFTFSQVTLVRLSQHLETRGIKVEVIAIPKA
jgi:uncharacterized protein (TIGR04141 family)